MINQISYLFDCTRITLRMSVMCSITMELNINHTSHVGNDSNRQWYNKIARITENYSILLNTKARGKCCAWVCMT